MPKKAVLKYRGYTLKQWQKVWRDAQKLSEKADGAILRIEAKMEKANGG